MEWLEVLETFGKTGVTLTDEEDSSLFSQKVGTIFGKLLFFLGYPENVQAFYGDHQKP
jgi:hypothetical protein